MSQGEDDHLSLEQTIEQLRSEIGGTLADALQPILHLNGQRGRIRQYLRLNPQETVQAYIFQVAHHYKANHEYLDQVQQQRNSETWEPLLEKIRQWAYRFLGRWNLDETRRMTYTLEIAQETSLEILCSHYPYDCEFDAWVCKITHHVCSKYMQRHGSPSAVDQMDLSEVDEWFQDAGKSPISNPEDEFATKQLLLDAIAQLSENQKSVIWSFYFEGQPLPQIAADLQVSINTIYKRHFDALKQLRKILGDNQHKDE